MGRTVRRALIGAGGWGYFAGGLPSYARAFSFVEVNASFYRPVSDSTARRWRATVPAGFTFAVKVHQDVTHRGRLRPKPAARAAFARVSRVARILGAPFLVLETPASLPLGPEELDGLREFAAMAPDGVRLALEARAHSLGPLPPGLARTLEDLSILDVTDVTRTAPRVANDVVYTRIFGKGDHNFWELDDEELREVDHVRQDATAVAFAFHGVRMYKDAARFLTFRRTGSFPPATGSVGLDSLAEVLVPDVRFPTDRDGLLRDHGWKVVDLTPTARAHASTLLGALPAGEYRDLASVLQALAPHTGRAVRGPVAARSQS